ncbi:helix-turn-helix domain-containing protein [Salmonella enterica subsp. salamae]|uniref:HTH cro/C1-type domain-containing protein n=1 Tax=Salmonella enterica subsp. salamae TaxID=59202 RepID=A0A5Y2LQW8_SALER|nr:helix-turn-helix domain-containing protein [Salmonella enterica]ECC1625860.1 helix-turn-helix domain-containing protein [Salmonella enterica subsp. salamae]ECE6360116.1 hypothetical protein [Salmonella enterica subsp. salamae]ECI5302808.1 helix-turn-helix domain-containing protein [Salmonella enterica subsp. salamae]EDV2638795.1 helix-turn-helix domain-containing protein [Salmonella enterica subsp. salamae]
MSAELNELNALIKTTTVSLQKISPPELLTAMQGIGRISSKLSGCLAEIQPSATTTAEPLIAATRTQLYAPYDGGMTIAFRIQLARENLGLSEADLARLLNTYSAHISDWEYGTTEPPASAIIPLANALKCDPLWLLTGNATHQFPATPDHQSRYHHSGPLRSDVSDHASHHEMTPSQA